MTNLSDGVSYNFMTKYISGVSELWTHHINILNKSTWATTLLPQIMWSNVLNLSTNWHYIQYTESHDQIS